MAESFGLVYRSLLMVEDLSPAIQDRIYNYGTRTKDYELLAALARHPRLALDLDARFAGVPHAVVKAAWAARPGRTDEQLSELVRNETRVKVLTALAQREDTPQKVYALIAQTKGQAPLAAIAANEAVDIETRVTAVGQLASVISPTAGTIPIHVLALIGSDDRFAIAAASTLNNPFLAMAALKSGAVSGELETRSVRVITETLMSKIRKALDSQDQVYSYEMYDARDFLSAATSVFQASGVNVESSKLVAECGEILSELKAANARYAHHVDEFLASTGSSASTALVAKARTASDEATLVAIVASITTGTQRNTSPEATLCAVAQNRHCTPDVIRMMFNSKVMHWNSIRTIASTITNPVSLGAILLWAPWAGLERVLARTTDPRAVLTHLLEIAGAKDCTVPREVMESKYMDSELIAMLPISSFYPNNTTPAMSEQLAQMLAQRVVDDTTWEVIETVAMNFSGSVDDLISIATSV
jgi:hypothetical protein